MTIVIPAAIVALIGLLAGLVLTLAANAMYVPVDERISAIIEVLPGANCGACGYAGCSDYANALGEDPELSTALCPVGGRTVSQQIAGIMGVEAGEANVRYAAVMCGGNYDATRKIMEADRIHTCKASKQLYGGQWACSYGCMGLGDCERVCSYGAIAVENGVARVDRSKCVGCGACVDICPNRIISMIDEKNLVYVSCRSSAKGGTVRKVCNNGCIGCMKCQKVCKFDAIHIENNLARVKYESCVNCGLCSRECPTGAIANLRKKKNASGTREREAEKPEKEGA